MKKSYKISKHFFAFVVLCFFVTDGFGQLISSFKTNVSCYGGSDGTDSLTVVPTVPRPLTFLWSNSATTQSLAGLSVGIYSVTVTDSLGATYNLTDTIVQPSVLTVGISSTNVSCHGGGNGFATATAAGGTSPYSYNWSSGGVGGSTQIYTFLSVGTYYVTVTDVKGCSAIDSVTITQPSSLTVGTSSTNVLCHGGVSGTGTASPVGGTSPYTYLWSSGFDIDSSTVTLLPTGTFYVTVTDNNGCTSTGSVTVTQPSALTASVTVIQNVLCYGGE